MKNRRYLTNRRALVGRGCYVNKLVSAVGVATWADSLGNVTNEDLTDYATFPAVLKVGVTVNPIVSVRDKTIIMARAQRPVSVLWPRREAVCCRSM